MKTILTLTITALFAAAAAHAEVTTKGGAAGLMKAPPVRAETRAPAHMACAQCKSEFVEVKVPASKGTGPTTTTVVRHACAACGTKWVTSGHGKGKQDTAVHTCPSCKS